MRYQVYNDTRHTQLAFRAEKADSFAKRFKGLLGRSSLEVGDGLHIEPCNSIHMFFMKFAIDVAFLDPELRVVKVIHGIKPWRATRIYSDARSVLELPVGALAGTQTVEGDVLRFQADARAE